MLNSLLLRKYYKFASLGLAALGFAMLPVAGVFAETGDGTMTFQETVAATIENACGLYTAYTDSETNTPVAGPYAYSKTMINGELWNSETSGTTLGATYIVVCNDNDGWKVTAVGSGADSNHVDQMKATGSSANIASGTATSGTAANWAFKIKAVAGTGVSTNKGSYHAVPTSAEDVVTGTSSTDGTATFTTGYQVYIGTATPADTYTGKVTYNLVHLPVSQQSQQSEQSNNSESSEPSEQPANQDSQNDSQDSGSTEEPLDTSNSEPSNSESANSNSQPDASPTQSNALSMSPVAQTVYVPTPVATQTSTSGNGSGDNTNTNSGDSSDTSDSKTDPLGMSTSTSSGSASTLASTSSTSSDNTGLIVALGVTAAAAAASAGAYLYTKSKE